MKGIPLLTHALAVAVVTLRQRT